MKLESTGNVNISNINTNEKSRLQQLTIAVFHKFVKQGGHMNQRTAKLFRECRLNLPLFLELDLLQAAETGNVAHIQSMKENYSNQLSPSVFEKEIFESYINSGINKQHKQAN